ncbi:phage tail protein [Cellulosilyticum sp. ST5]|uniref:phage tail-collar fiber domain-containing protein n=1 Tax=Cellulosilyticum sp. ST5 TaxID=3055805 RepID=UPI00397763A3
MSEFKNKSITVKGMELLSKALAGEPIEFTRMELGDGQYDGDLGFAEKLINVKQNLPINKLDRNGSQVTLSAVLKVEDILSSFEWSEIGIYAKGADNIEHLYMYSYTENTSYISRDSLNEKLIHVTVMVSNAAQITATIDDSLVYLTAESLAQHNMDHQAHEDIRENMILLAGQVADMEIRLEDINSIKDEIISAIEKSNKGAVKKVSTYKGKINKIDISTTFPVTISAVDSTKSSINVIKCSADLVIPYISNGNTVLFQNMSASTAYSNIVYGFEIIEYN